MKVSFQKVICDLTRERKAWAHLHEDDSVHVSDHKRYRIGRYETYGERLKLKLVPNTEDTANVRMMKYKDSKHDAVGKRHSVVQTGIDTIGGLNHGGAPILSSECEAASENGSLYVCSCDLISPEKTQKGLFRISKRFVYFETLSREHSIGRMKTSESEAKKDMNFEVYLRFPVADIWRACFRRHRLAWCALELFIGKTNRTTYFFTFPGHTECKKALVHIGRLIGRSDTIFLPKGHDLFRRLNQLSELWAERKISNLRYLMILNTLAGRTYNDLAQYPIMPWVVADYQSERLDLSNPKSFRDFEYPVAAQTEQAREYLKARYQETGARPEGDGGISEADDAYILQGPPWHYGTHYLSRGTVLWYLVRLEPFTSLHVSLQDGRFDHADRQFSSLADAWTKIAKQNGMELIPEFFGSGEFLRVDHGVDLGYRQDGRIVGDVDLPPWASGSPETFIHLNRAALESEYTSANLHKWIDLIFGFKQRGKHAVKAFNVYFHLMYDDAVDLGNLQRNRSDLYRTVMKMCQEYGQIPPQLFQSPHKTRKPRIPYGMIPKVPTRFTGVKKLDLGTRNTPALVYSVNHEQGFALIDSHDIMTIYDLEAPSLNSIMSDSHDPDWGSSNSTSIVNKTLVAHLGGVRHQEVSKRHKKHFALWKKTVFSCGYWDNSIRSKQMLDESPKVRHHGHDAFVTCIALDERGFFLASGSMDGTIIVWELEHISSSSRVSITAKHHLSSHDAGIACLAACSELDLIVSGSFDGSCNLYNMQEGDLLRTIRKSNRKLDVRSWPTWIGVSYRTGFVVAFYPHENLLISCTVNGEMVSRTYETKFCYPGIFSFCHNGRYILGVHSNGQVKGYDVNTLLSCEFLITSLPKREKIIDVEALEGQLLISTASGNVFHAMINSNIL